jgi:hypothetical protein
MPRLMFSRWDPLNPTNILAVVLLGWAFSVFHRPHLPEFLPSYMHFDDLMPWLWWGRIALCTALLMLFTPRSSGWRLLAHALCGLFMLGVSVVFAGGVGVTSAVTTYSVLAGVSAVLFARTGVNWASGARWWARLVNQPPKWLRRLALINEVERG